MRWEPRIIKSFHLNFKLFWCSDLAMPVSSQLSSLASIWGYWNNINDSPQLSLSSTVSRVVMLGNYQVISEPPPAGWCWWLTVSSLFIISSAHCSLFFSLVKFWSQVSRNYDSDQRIFHRFLCQQKPVCWVHPPSGGPNTPHPALLWYSKSALCPIWPRDPHLSRRAILGPVLF